MPFWKKILVAIAGWFVGMFSIAIIIGPSASAWINFLPALFTIIYPIVFYRMTRRIKKMKIQCPNCKYEGIGKFAMKGSSSVELLLWLFFLIPGLIYGTWRGSTKRWICPQCDFENVVKLWMVEVL